jgi:hypothetical protein
MGRYVLVCAVSIERKTDRESHQYILLVKFLELGTPRRVTEHLSLFTIVRGILKEV